MLRYKVNILEELKKAGYSSYRMRQEKVLSESTLQRIREGSPTITLESIGVICDILQCQPGDLVERVENGVVYTVEGNTSDSCRQRSYSVGHYEIWGYGCPAYN